MKKIINIENQPVEVNSSMGWLFVYREQFGRDILPDLLPILDAVLNTLASLYDKDEISLTNLDDDTIEQVIATLSGLEVVTIVNILWAMAKNNDPTVTDPKSWANSFDVFPMDIVVVELGQLLVESCVSSKNSSSLLAKLQKK